MEKWDSVLQLADFQQLRANRDMALSNNHKLEESVSAVEVAAVMMWQWSYNTVLLSVSVIVVGVCTVQTPPSKFLHFQKVVFPNQGLFWGKNNVPELNLDSGPCGENAKFLKRLLVPGESSCGGNGAKEKERERNKLMNMNHKWKLVWGFSFFQISWRNKEGRKESRKPGHELEPCLKLKVARHWLSSLFSAKPPAGREGLGKWTRPEQQQETWMERWEEEKEGVVAAARGLQLHFMCV